MTISPEKFSRLKGVTIEQVMAVVADRYGRKMADDLAKELVSGKPIPVVDWPRFE